MIQTELNIFVLFMKLKCPSLETLRATIKWDFL